MAQYLDKEGLELVVSKTKTLIDDEIKITGIKVNDETQDVVDKIVNLFVPTKTSELDNDSDYTTTKETKSEIAAQIAEIVAGAPESLDTLKEIADWIENHAEDAAAMNSQIQENTESIKKVEDEIPTKVSQLENDSKYITASDVPTKVSELENDADYITVEATEKEIDEKIAEIVADAPESLDTLKEIADWIENHSSDAAEMNSEIKQNAENITDILEQLANSSSLGFTYDESTETLTFDSSFSVSYDEPTETLTF